MFYVSPHRVLFALRHRGFVDVLFPPTNFFCNPLQCIYTQSGCFELWHPHMTFSYCSFVFVPSHCLSISSSKIKRLIFSFYSSLFHFLSEKKQNNFLNVNKCSYGQIFLKAPNFCINLNEEKENKESEFIKERQNWFLFSQKRGFASRRGKRDFRNLDEELFKLRFEEICRKTEKEAQHIERNSALVSKRRKSLAHLTENEEEELDTIISLHSCNSGEKKGTLKPRNSVHHTQSSVQTPAHSSSTPSPLQCADKWKELEMHIKQMEEKASEQTGKKRKITNKNDYDNDEINIANKLFNTASPPRRFKRNLHKNYSEKKFINEEEENVNKFFNVLADKQEEETNSEDDHYENNIPSKTKKIIKDEHFNEMSFSNYNNFSSRFFSEEDVEEGKSVNTQEEERKNSNFSFRSPSSQAKSIFGYESLKVSPLYQDLTHDEAKKMQEVYEKKCYIDRKIRWMKMNGLPNPEKEAKHLIKEHRQSAKDEESAKDMDGEDDMYPPPFMDEHRNNNKVTFLENDAKMKELTSRIRMKIRQEKLSNAKLMKASIPNVAGNVIDPIKYHIDRRTIRVNRMLQSHLEQFLTWNTPHVLFQLLGGLSISISHLEMKTPRSVCNVYYTVTGENNKNLSMQEIQAKLGGASTKLRCQMARKLELGYTPAFKFIPHTPQNLFNRDRLRCLVDSNYHTNNNLNKMHFDSHSKYNTSTSHINNYGDSEERKEDAITRRRKNKTKEKNEKVNYATLVKELWEKSINGLG